MKKALILPALLLLCVTLFAQTPSFQDFLAQFPKAELPYSINVEDMQAPAAAGRLNWDFYAFLPELEHSAEFFAMPVYPEPVAMFETEKYFAVVYNVAHGIRKDKSYSMSVFNKKGDHIATNFVAGNVNGKVTTVNIDANLQAVAKMNSNSQNINLLVPGNPDQLEWSVVPTIRQVSSGVATSSK